MVTESTRRIAELIGGSHDQTHRHRRYLEPIGLCRSSFVADLRSEVLAELDKHGLSTEAAREHAARAVRATLVAQHGAKIVRRDVVGAYFGEVVLGSIVALGVLFYFVSRRVRRSEEEGH